MTGKEFLNAVTNGETDLLLPRAEPRTVLGYPLRVAAAEDVLQGKLWAYQDESRRPSKRQKDLADLARLVEARPELAESLPEAVQRRLA